ncbi:hypothetical protein CYLTODRAFT_416977 [Cylindrobasidium torrendii FP15055 ss-10]|uniref:Uncharacterized protein n=1 Tax=Cylindrobasidium torrendii FP15055 ss-10 TaxID=1314674 RepID=A0A0D7BVE8_9AGAR|nr:hypothetical protein CYLTODRAFT_416977 [Cylindrobasidium torrendii FP15055 ss-10]
MFVFSSEAALASRDLSNRKRKPAIEPGTERSITKRNILTAWDIRNQYLRGVDRMWQSAPLYWNFVFNLSTENIGILKTDMSIFIDCYEMRRSIEWVIQPESRVGRSKSEWADALSTSYKFHGKTKSLLREVEFRSTSGQFINFEKFERETPGYPSLPPVVIMETDVVPPPELPAYYKVENDLITVGRKLISSIDIARISGKNIDRNLWSEEIKKWRAETNGNSTITGVNEDASSAQVPVEQSHRVRPSQSPSFFTDAMSVMQSDTQRRAAVQNGQHPLFSDPNDVVSQPLALGRANPSAWVEPGAHQQYAQLSTHQEMTVNPAPSGSARPLHTAQQHSNALFPLPASCATATSPVYVGGRQQAQRLATSLSSAYRESNPAPASTALLSHSQRHAGGGRANKELPRLAEKHQSGSGAPGRSRMPHEDEERRRFVSLADDDVPESRWSTLAQVGDYEPEQPHASGSTPTPPVPRRTATQLTDVSTAPPDYTSLYDGPQVNDHGDWIQDGRVVHAREYRDMPAHSAGGAQGRGAPGARPNRY